MCEWSGHNVRMNMQCASASLVNARAVRLQCASAIVWSMCEWSGHNVQMNMQCASASLVNVRAVRLQCASKYGMCECEYSDVRVIGYVRVEMCECE